MIYTKDNDRNIYLEIGDNTYSYDPDSQPIGKGGYGVVYLGHDCSTGAPVAIKRMHEGVTKDPVRRSRAKAEASFRFDHPHIIQMLGYCENTEDTGPLYVVSRYVKGVGIKEYIKTRFKDSSKRAEKICEMMYPIIDALAYIHKAGILHRDLKHTQMMASEEGAYLMDLGLTYNLDNNRMTIEPNNNFSTIGTPIYMSPEQLCRSLFGKGRPEQHKQRFMQLTPATDIYCLGLTIYELLTDYVPFSSTSEEKIAKRVFTRHIIPSRWIPHEVFKVLEKATAFDPKNRYQNCGEFLTALKAAKKQFDLHDRLMFIPNVIRFHLDVRKG